MFRKIGLIILLGLFSSLAQAVTQVRINTSMGSFELDLYEDKAPETVANFVRYAEDGYYNGLIFHRVIDGWIIQGGGYGPDMQPRETRAPIKNEASSQLKNTRGTIAMARLFDPHSADSQFFINLQDSPTLDFRSKSPTGFGYCVFGTVTKGMDIVDAIGSVKTGIVEDMSDVPLKPVLIESVEILSNPVPKS